jgi:hypothetical protein
MAQSPPPRLFSDVYGVSMPEPGHGSSQPPMLGISQPPMPGMWPVSAADDGRPRIVLQQYGQNRMGVGGYDARRQSVEVQPQDWRITPAAASSTGRITPPAPPFQAMDYSQHSYVPAPVINGFVPIDGAVIQEEYAPEPRSEFWMRSGALFLLAIPALAIYFAVFSEFGFGASIFKNLIFASVWPRAAAAGGAAFVLLVYVLDFSYWKSGGFAFLRALTLCMMAAGACIAAAISFHTVPYAPTMTFWVIFLGYFAVIYSAFFPRTRMVDFNKSLGVALIMAGLGAAIAALLWYNYTNFWWGNDSQVEFRDRLRVCEDDTVGNGFCTRYGIWGVKCKAGCKEVAERSPCDPSMTDECLPSFLLWAGPMIVSFLTFIVGVALLVVSMLVSGAIKKTGAAESVFRTATFRSFILANFILIAIIYVAAEMGGSSSDLSGLVIAFAMLGIILLLAIVCYTVGLANMRDAVSSSAIFKKIFALRSSDWIKALALSIVVPILPFILIISALNQSLRKCLPITKTLTDEDRHLTLTLAMHNIVEGMKKWHWTSVIRKSIVLGFLYFVLVVIIGKITQLFLAWLNINLSEAGLSLW